MGNHNIDCKFCHQDQRLTGIECCEDSAREERIRQENRFAEKERLRAIIRQVDPDACILSGDYLDRMYLSDVVKLIQRIQLEERS
jgi:hypothetical protein